MNAILVDDEAPARKRLRKMITEIRPDIHIVGESPGGQDAISLIVQHEPDVLFLDIQMPGLDGFELLRSLPSPPLVVFVTAYDEFALRAFEAHAIDYLLKPVERSRLARTAEKLDLMLQNKSSHTVNLERLLTTMADGHRKRVRVRVGDRILLVDTDDILYFEATDKYTTAHTATQRHLLTETLKELEHSLDPAQFIRIHRKCIVQISAIGAIEVPSKDHMQIVLRGDKKRRLDVGRSYVKSVRAL